jgi:DNA sulfur modification protein DndD
MAKITFRGIGLQNLGPFKRRQYLDLRTGINKPIVLVQALNGSGKTTLLTALQVVLYGTKLYGNGRGREYEQLMLGLQRRDAEGDARIDLDLRAEGQGEIDDFTVSRSWSVQGGKLHEKLVVHRDGALDAQLTEEWDAYLDGLLPAELVQLFLFDGEKIEALANPATLPDMLRRATEAFLGIGGIDALAKDLVAAERRSLLKGRHNNPKYDAAKIHLNTLELQRAQLETELPRLAAECASKQILVDQSKRALENFQARGERSGLTAYEGAAALRAEEQQASQNLARARDRVREALANPWSALARLGSLWTDYELLHDQEKDIRTAQYLIEAIKKRDDRIIQALCNSISADALGTVRKVLTRDQETYLASNGRILRLVSSELPSEARLKIDASMEQLNAAVKDLEVAQADLVNLERRLAGIPDGEQIADLLSQLQSHSAKLALGEAQLIHDIKLYQAALASKAHLDTRIGAATETLRKDFGGFAHEAKSLETSHRAREVLSLFKNRLLASKAHWLSKMITSEFASLMRKRMLISQVRIHPDTYQVTIVVTDGYELPMERLSAGERQLLAIAVLSALIRERKGQFPVAVDTPLARLDKQHRRTLVHHFFSKISHQVMVLSTDEEVDDALLSEVMPSMSQSYVLEFSDDNRSTTVLNQAEGYTT